MCEGPGWTCSFFAIASLAGEVMRGNLPGENAMRSTLLLTGCDLKREDFYEVVLQRRQVGLHTRARRAMTRSRSIVEQMVEHKDVVYGVNTGVGALSTERIEPEKVRQLQLNLVRSHACGVGDPLKAEETRGLLLLRANVLAQGYSGVRPDLAELLCEFLNGGIHPVVPSRGSVGASGDLAPLAHVALALVGEGEAVVQSPNGANAKRMPARKAIESVGLKPLTLEAKEGLSLVNGTQAMLSLGLLALREAQISADTADVAGALSLDSLRGSPAAFDDRVQQARPHPGQVRSARNLARLNRGSSIRESHRGCARVQDAYSLRCMPQVHGAVRDSLGHVQRVLEIEMNSVTDNPLVFVEPNYTQGNQSRAKGRKTFGDRSEVISGGNFHGQPIATVLDLMAIALTQLGAISERRIDRMVNPLTSELPPFLAHSPGLESGFMLAQVTAAALVAENKVLAHPASIDSIPTSGSKEDFVSMGMGAALKLKPILANVALILSVELLTACRALDLLAPLRTGTLAEKARHAVRRVAPALNIDRSLTAEIERVATLVRAGEIAAVLGS
jgi:histidine ammonia-lyase